MSTKLSVLIASVLLVGSCGSLPEDLVSYWSFDEDSGEFTTETINSYRDSISYIYNGQTPANDPIRRKGISSNALEFDGFSSFISRDASEFTFPAGDFTISAWVAPRAFEHGDEQKISPVINQQDPSKKEGFAFGLFRHGHWSFQMGNGESWYEIWDENHPVPRRRWSNIAVSFDSNLHVLRLYLNGEMVSSSDVSAFGVKQSSEPLVIGRHNFPAVDGRSILNMYNGLLDELKIYSRAFDAEDAKAVFAKDLKKHKGEIPELSYEEIKISREKYRNDPYRPELHANPPGHWMNEPHAPFFYNGKYHLTYQHNPTGPYWHNMTWGHWVSDDLVHWKDKPEVIFPEDNDVAPDGIWSGSATFDQNGDPVLVYTFGNWNKERNQGIALAFPKDKNDPELTEWTTLDHTTIEQQEGQGITGEFRDPFTWRDPDTGKWYMLVGSGIEGKGGTAWAYESDNVLDWTLKGAFYLSNYKKYPFLGDKWELPVFLPLGKYENGETRYVLIISPKGYLQNVEVYYWLGRFDKETCTFIPENEEPLYWDYGGNRFIGPSGLIDPKGRALIFTVVGGNGTGWAGTCGFPSHIFLDQNGKLGVKPIEELNSLRTNQILSLENESVASANEKLSSIGGNLLEIYLEMDSKDASKMGIKILKDPEGKEETLLYYDAQNSKLMKDTSLSQIRQSGSRMPSGFTRRSTDQREDLRNHFELDGETLKMHIYIDKALIQAYVNDRNTITTWAYPTLKESRGVEVFSEGAEAVIKKLDIWQLGSIYY